MSELFLIQLLLAFLSIVGIFLLVPLVGYLFMGLGLMKMAENHEIPNGWLGFIPIANMYLLGQLVNDVVEDSLKGKMHNYLLVLALASFFLSWIPLIGWLIVLANLGLSIYAIFHLFNKFSDKGVALFVINLITFGLFYGFMIFAIRNGGEKVIELPLAEEA